MPPDSALTRAVLQTFGHRNQDEQYVTTDGLQLVPPTVHGYSSDVVWEEADRLVALGLLVRTREIRMRYHNDMPTLRATDRGREFVWRAFDDGRWEEGLDVLRTLEEHRVTR